MASFVDLQQNHESKCVESDTVRKVRQKIHNHLEHIVQIRVLFSEFQNDYKNININKTRPYSVHKQKTLSETLTKNFWNVSITVIA